MTNRRQLKLPRTGAEVLSIGQRPEDGASTIEAREGEGVSVPVDLNTLSLQGEEDDQGTNSNGAREGRRGDAESVRQYKIRNQVY